MPQVLSYVVLAHRRSRGNFSSGELSLTERLSDSLARCAGALHACRRRMPRAAVGHDIDVKPPFISSRVISCAPPKKTGNVPQSS